MERTVDDPYKLDPELVHQLAERGADAFPLLWN
jgi:hypothetical protein